MKNSKIHFKYSTSKIYHYIYLVYKRFWEWNYLPVKRLPKLFIKLYTTSAYKIYKFFTRILSTENKSAPIQVYLIYTAEIINVTSTKITWTSNVRLSIFCLKTWSKSAFFDFSGKELQIFDPSHLKLVLTLGTLWFEFTNIWVLHLLKTL